MPIPVGRLYQKKHLGNGTVATVEDNTVNTVQAGADINFGVGISLQPDANGKMVAVTAKSAPIFGIAIKRNRINGDDYDAIPNDHFLEGEVFGALRKGGISVPVSEDVSRYENATVDADGSFRVAKAGEQVVGVFLTDGNALTQGDDDSGTAIVQVNLTDMVVPSAGTQSTTPATNSNSQTTTPGK